MGEDISIKGSPFDFYPLTTEEDDQEQWITERSSAISLLPLLCFRYYDLKIIISESGDDPRACMMPEIRYIVSSELAIKQLLAGVEVLKNKFQGASALDPYVESFIKSISNYKFIHMCFSDFSYLKEFDLLLHHALLGIQYPDMKMYYDLDPKEKWHYFRMPAPTGIMTWSGALRRLTRIGVLKTVGFPDHEELFTDSDVNDGYFDKCVT